MQASLASIITSLDASHTVHELIKNTRTVIKLLDPLRCIQIMILHNELRRSRRISCLPGQRVNSNAFKGTSCVRQRPKTSAPKPRMTAHAIRAIDACFNCTCDQCFNRRLNSYHAMRTGRIMMMGKKRALLPPEAVVTGVDCVAVVGVDVTQGAACS